MDFPKNKLSKIQNSFFYGLVLLIVCILVILLIQVHLIINDFREIKMMIGKSSNHSHIMLRSRFIANQIKTISYKYILILGDSNIENIYFPTLEKVPLVNGGVGGVGIYGVYKLIKELPVNKNMKACILAVGVNDAKKSTQKNPISNWKYYYKCTMREVKKRTDCVYLCSILPLEAGKGLGPEYFDESKIAEFNRYIKGMARNEQVGYIDASEIIVKAGKDYTVDGVHLTPLAAIKFRDAIIKALASTCIGVNDK